MHGLNPVLCVTKTTGASQVNTYLLIEKKDANPEASRLQGQRLAPWSQTEPLKNAKWSGRQAQLSAFSLLMCSSAPTCCAKAVYEVGLRV
jgi:hypothetical protein